MCRLLSTPLSEQSSAQEIAEVNLIHQLSFYQPPSGITLVNGHPAPSSEAKSPEFDKAPLFGINFIFPLHCPSRREAQGHLGGEYLQTINAFSAGLFGL